MKTRRACFRSHNGLDNEDNQDMQDLQCILDSLSIQTCQEMQPVIKWMENHYNWSNYQNFHWLIREVLDQKLESKEEEPTPIQSEPTNKIFNDEGDKMMTMMTMIKILNQQMKRKHGILIF